MKLFVALYVTNPVLPQKTAHFISPSHQCINIR